MSERHRFRCGHLPARRERGPWSQVEAISLRIGKRSEDIRLDASSLSGAIVGHLDGFAWDLLDLAAYVYVADQMVSRGGRKEFEYGQKWRRHFRFEVAVRDPDRWNRPDVLDALTETLTFLSDDDYEFVFLPTERPTTREDYFFADWDDPLAHTYREVVLFSGGIDSLCGAVMEMFVATRRLALVSHWSNSKILARQRELIRSFREQSELSRSLYPIHIALSLNKKKQLTRDFDQRTRSIVFATLGAIVATGLGLDGFRICENGITSLNLPISPQIVGARASRTTHPKTLAGFQRLFSALWGRPVRVENPYQFTTKTTMLERLRLAGKSWLVAQTCSCAHTQASCTTHPHCGVCSQCVDRRLTCLAAGLGDADDPPRGYRASVLTGVKTGADLVMVERYYGTALRFEKFVDPLQLLLAYPELARVLRYLSTTPTDSLKAIHALTRQHGEQICTQVGRLIASEGQAIARQTIPANTLLGIALGARWKGERRTVPNAELPCDPVSPGGRPVADEDSFAIVDRGRECILGNTQEFHLFKLLLKNFGKFVAEHRISQAVWNKTHQERNAIQRVVSNLRKALRSHRLDDLSIESQRGGYYRLSRPRPGRKK